MKMKVNRVIEITNRLASLGGKKLPSSLNYALIKNKKTLMDELECIMEQRDSIIKDYCEKDTNGKPVIDDEGHAEFSKDGEQKATEEYAAFLNSEIEIDIKKVGFEDIEKCDTIEPLTAAEMELIEFMVD